MTSLFLSLSSSHLRFGITLWIVVSHETMHVKCLGSKGSTQYMLTEVVLTYDYKYSQILFFTAF